MKKVVSTPLSTKSPTLGLRMFNKVKLGLVCILPDDVPSVLEVE